MKRSQKHIIHKAKLWKKMLDEGKVKSLSEIAQKEGMTRARVTQIINLLKLPAKWQEFLAGLDDPKEIRKYSEQKTIFLSSLSIPSGLLNINLMPIGGPSKLKLLNIDKSNESWLISSSLSIRAGMDFTQPTTKSRLDL